MFVNEDQTKKMLDFLTNEHFRYHRRVGEAPLADEIDLSGGYAIDLQVHETPLLTRMRRDFQEFMDKCMCAYVDNEADQAHTISFALAGASDDESFSIGLSDEGIKIEAGGERGLLHASHYLERQFAFRGGPFAKKGVIARSPAFSPRISNTVFDAPDEYLSLLSHFGVNGLRLAVCLWDYAGSHSVPELANPSRTENVERLNALCDKAAAHGIDIYLAVMTGFFSDDAPVFAKRPGMKGALLNYETPGDRYCLCSSHPDTLLCYREAFADLAGAVPSLGGLALIVGGEGFVHCFTRPKAPPGRNTSCPRCAGRNPSEDVANLVNLAAESVHAVNSKVKVFAWPYSAFAWSGDADFAQVELIRNLNEDVLFLSNFDTPHAVRFGDSEAFLADYNIVNIGPSEQFKEQSRALEETGKAHYAKYEDAVEPGWFFLPYLPLPYRWIERTDRMKEWKVAGCMSKWEFYGFTGSIPEEILCEITWKSDTDPDELMTRIARRDFGEVSDKILRGWKVLSDVWPRIPASHMIYGERQYYMKGPVYLGPAHPLIFDVQNRYGLGSRFFTLRGDASEILSESEIQELTKTSPPRYSSDLLFTYPFGAEAVEEDFKSAMDEWEAGVGLIAEALGDNPNERARMELNVCRILGMHLRAAWNVTRFYRARDSFFTSSGTRDTIDETMRRLTEILDDEIDNAKRALLILEDDFRIGYGYHYGQAYDVEMVRDKIRQCEYVRNVELPGLTSGILFHVYQQYRV